MTGSGSCRVADSQGMIGFEWNQQRQRTEMIGIVIVMLWSFEAPPYIESSTVSLSD